jgi:hypothetical protein
MMAITPERSRSLLPRIPAALQHGIALPPAGPRAACYRAAQGRTPRARERAQPGGQARRFLRPEKIELIVRVLEKEILKCD